MNQELPHGLHALGSRVHAWTHGVAQCHTGSSDVDVNKRVAMQTLHPVPWNGSISNENKKRSFTVILETSLTYASVAKTIRPRPYS